MKLWLKLFVAIFFVSLGVVGWNLSRSTQPDVQSVLSNLGLQGDFKKFSTYRFLREEIKTYLVTEIGAAQTGSNFKAIIIEKGGGAASAYFDQRLFQINSQFNRGASPYPGAVSVHIDCPPDFEPIIESVQGQGWTGKLIQTYASTRKQFGVCAIKERKYRAAVLIMVCKNSGNIFDLTLLSPLEGSTSPTEKLKSVTCL